LSPEEILSKVK